MPHHILAAMQYSLTAVTCSVRSATAGSFAFVQARSVAGALATAPVLAGTFSFGTEALRADALCFAGVPLCASA